MRKVIVCLSSIIKPDAFHDLTQDLTAAQPDHLTPVVPVGTMDIPPLPT
jgi:hypothetical protein